MPKRDAADRFDGLDGVLQECRDADERERLSRLWQRLDVIGAHQPPPELATRFAAAIRGARATAEPPRSRAWTLAAGLAVGLLLGGSVGVLLSGAESAEAELQQTREALAGVTRPDATAVSRLAAVQALGSAAAVDRELREALTAVATADRNVNVRLVAVRALAGELHRPEVEATLAGLLDAAGDPMMKLALIDLFVENGVAAAMPALERIEADEAEEPLVRERAGWASDTLRRGRNAT